MKPKQVIEVLTQERNYWKRKYEMHKNNPSPIIRELYKRKVESLDHAINCVGAIEQIKWERDIAIQQLNELGLGLGQKTNEVKKIIDAYKDLDNGHALKHSSKNVIQYNRKWLYENLESEFDIHKSVKDWLIRSERNDR